MGSALSIRTMEEEVRYAFGQVRILLFGHGKRVDRNGEEKFEEVGSGSRSSEGRNKRRSRVSPPF